MQLYFSYLFLQGGDFSKGNGMTFCPVTVPLPHADSLFALYIHTQTNFCLQALVEKVSMVESLLVRFVYVEICLVDHSYVSLLIFSIICRREF